ncbi:MAG: PilX N-terminal domain-containing pilus assembly protein [Gammaproteobacteria bacterium]|nr:PilX N-terminal domain-containing pilus assembly protein [Gammaproteobacteria bacterium]
MAAGRVLAVIRAAPGGRARRDGIALFVCLVVLLALGVAAVSASQTVSLEVRMARNGHDGQLALQAAEAALREGERLVASTGFDPSAPGLYGSSGFGELEPWSRPDTWRSGNSRVAAPLDGVAEPPRFIVERITSGVGETVFRVTARAVGGTPHAVVVLQGTFTLSPGDGRRAAGSGRATRLSWRELDAR